MKVTFRQGMIRRSTVLSAPNFLQKTTMAGTSIDLIATLQPTVITFAHYDSNYIVEETKDVSKAWGGASSADPEVNNAALSPSATQYLYWDIDFNTATLRRGWTSLYPIVSSVAPVNPVNDQHWFDTANTVMMVFRKNSPTDPGKWLPKIRVFAATYNSSAIIVPYPLGSQINVSGGSYEAGHIILGVNSRPLRSGDDKGTFFTTETNVTVINTGGQTVKFDATVVMAQANEDIPKFSCVSFVSNRRIVLTTTNNIYRFVSGVVIEDLHSEERGQIITNGLISNDQWPAEALAGDQGRPLPIGVTDPDFWLIKNHINEPIFVDATGQFTLNPPDVGFVQQVGYVYDADAVYINLFAPVRL